ncbi:trypsin eta-like [Culicoides brevitarsis]|uniref:trypsin eta-like n=1 Tax=Culicoides brevitarsis TaxID=469753 RepID=UPI00307C018A
MWSTKLTVFVSSSSAIYLLLVCLVAPTTGATGLQFDVDVTSGADPVVATTEAQVWLRGDVNGGADKFLCDATILRENYVVTAAFCVHQRARDNIKIVISRSGNGIYYDVVKVVFHPLFNANTLANDIAVIQVADPITFVPGIIEKAELPGTVLRGGNTLTMRDGIQTTTLTNYDCQYHVGLSHAGLVKETNVCTLAWGNTTVGYGILHDKINLLAMYSWKTADVYVLTRIEKYRFWILAEITK